LKETLRDTWKAKVWAKELIEGKLTEHYARVWDYAHELVRSNPGSTCKVGVICNYIHKTPDTFMNAYFSKETFLKCYSSNIQPVNGNNLWAETEFIKPLPPMAKRMPGRPATKRKRHASENESKFSSGKLKVSRTVRCGNCLEYGHNQKTCKNPSKEFVPPPAKKTGSPRKNPLPTNTAGASSSTQPPAAASRSTQPPASVPKKTVRKAKKMDVRRGPVDQGPGTQQGGSQEAVTQEPVFQEPVFHEHVTQENPTVQGGVFQGMGLTEILNEIEFKEGGCWGCGPRQGLLGCSNHC